MLFNNGFKSHFYTISIAISITLLFCYTLGIAFSETNSSLKNQNIQTIGKQTDSIGWDKIITLAGATGIISILGTGLFSRYNTKKQLEIQQKNILKQIEIQQNNAISLLQSQLDKTIKEMQHERQLDGIQERLNLYASFVFILKRLRELILHSPSVSQEKLNKIEEEINSLIGVKFYLLGPIVVTRWLKLNDELIRNNAEVTSIKSLIDQLILEYNKEIREQYNELIGTEIPILED
jgi:hypothetical protein